MQPIRSRKDLLSPVMNECTEENNTRQLLYKKSRGLKVKLKKCLLLFFSVEEYTQFRPLYVVFSVFICQRPQEKMKQTTQNGKCLVQFWFTCLFLPENSLILFNLWIKIVCEHFSCSEPNKLKGKSLYYLKLKLSRIKFRLKNNVEV